MFIKPAVIESNSYHMNLWMLFVLNVVLLFLELESKFSCQFNLDVYFSLMMDLHGHDKIIARDLELPDANIFRKYYVLHLSKTSGENKSLPDRNYINADLRKRNSSTAVLPNIRH